MDITLNVNVNWPAEPPAWLKPYLAAITRIESQMADETAAIAALTTAVNTLATSTASEVTELQTISGELTTIAGNQGVDNSAALNALATRISDSASALDAAATAAKAADPTGKTGGSLTLSPTTFTDTVGDTAFSGAVTVSGGTPPYNLASTGAPAGVVFTTSATGGTYAGTFAAGSDSLSGADSSTPPLSLPATAITFTAA